MNLPQVGETIAVQYQRNPVSRVDAALSPSLFLGRVKGVDEYDIVTAAMMTVDNLPEETLLRWDAELQEWTDMSFERPIETVTFGLGADLVSYLAELETLEEHEPAEVERPLAELRLRFLAAGFEYGWLPPQGPMVFYSDDLIDARAGTAHWGGQKLGEYTAEADAVEFVWPVEGREESEWGVRLVRREDGAYHSKSEHFGDEFTALAERRAGYWFLYGHWDTEEERIFFAVVLPEK